MEKFHTLFINDIKRRLFLENQNRIVICLNLISEEQLWNQPNENLNSIGNLILHLCGNITQYVNSGIFREKDLRNRTEEFENSKPYNKADILNYLNETMSIIERKLEIITADMLLKDYKVQGFNENGVSILVHITEHFSYHVGQITLLTKLFNNIDTAYYGGMDLNAKST